MPDARNRVPASESAKFVRLVEHIRALDAEDVREHKTKFKHFVFTDIRESAYGVKALTSFLMDAGFEFRMGLEKKKIMRHGKMVETKNGETVLLEQPAQAGGCDGFAVLQSLPLWKNPLTVQTKKQILSVYNSRPENAHGERLRIIVLDSKFKEGIDLFDVKYVHLLEPAIAGSDLKQAVGRATRYCGQKGLHFVPSQGWPLDVFVYTATLPNRAPFDGADAHDLMLTKSGLDLAMMNLTKELTVLAIRTAVDYDLNYKINNFQAALLDVDDIVAEVIDDFKIAQEAQVAEVAEEADKASLAQRARAIGGRQRQRQDRLVAIHSPDDITPTLMKKCLLRKSKLFPFSKLRLERVAKQMGLQPPGEKGKGKAKRAWYCEQLKSHPHYLERMLQSDVTPLQAKKKQPSSAVSVSSASASSASSIESEIEQVFPSPSPSPSPSPVADMRQIQALSSTMSFSEFQSAIVQMYSKYKWASPVVKNGCDQQAAFAPGTAVTFTQTQDFVRHYLTPRSPFKGLLAWHSVGTGKTCMAIAAATTQFEQAGYSILWVTRNSLMADVYKNMFGSICSIPIQAIREKGPLPTDLKDQTRLLSKAWFAPISYRTFQNALQGKNELGRMLPKEDPLRNTFLIMDEIHKLQDGDLGPAESADFSTIQSYIHKSYQVSGDQSVRPLLMTATPITDSPKELFAILNTLIPAPSDRLMPFDEFRAEHTQENGTITPEGETYFQERAKGLISYLNREYDPSTFAQPVFHTIRVPILDVRPPTKEELLHKCEGKDKGKDKGKGKGKGGTLRACYNKEKKAFTEAYSKSQISDVEKCLSVATPFLPFSELSEGKQA